MRNLFAFMKKEWMEWTRTGRVIILAIIFLLLGIMNPAIAKLTPWMMELMSESLEESGLLVTSVEVDALTSWTQFFKNIPFGLIAFILICSVIFTKEYQSGTLVLILTKGLKRSKVVAAKSILLCSLWTVLYWFCYGITYLYNWYFWDNSVVQNLVFAAACWWLFGMWTIALMILFSVFMNTNTGVLTAVGVIVFGVYLFSMIPKVGNYIPTKLIDCASLLTGVVKTDTYETTILLTCIFIILCIFISLPIMNKKQI